MFSTEKIRDFIDVFCEICKELSVSDKTVYSSDAIRIYQYDSPNYNFLVTVYKNEESLCFEKRIKINQRLEESIFIDNKKIKFSYVTRIDDVLKDIEFPLCSTEEDIFQHSTICDLRDLDMKDFDKIRTLYSSVKNNLG